MKFSADEKYQQPLISTLVYIQTHLGDDLPLDELARRAGFSPYHFHRIFTEFVGEPVKEHIRRLRLERGAYRLKISQDLVLQIALEAGFKTHESFTRAFARKFGVNPSHFRQDFLKAAQERKKRRGAAAQAMGASALRGDPGLLPNGATAARTSTSSRSWSRSSATPAPMTACSSQARSWPRSGMNCSAGAAPAA
jgi:AraC-like DNA-binding protein